MARRCAPAAALAAAALALVAPDPGAPVSGAHVAGDTQQVQRGGAWRPAVRAANRYARKRPGTVRFAVTDTRGKLYERGGYARVRMLSTVKVMLLVAYLREPDVRKRALTDGERDLLRPMIRRSDNRAASVIRDRLGRAPLERLAKRAGMRGFRWDPVWGFCRTTARDQAIFMRELRRHVPVRHWDFARKQLRRIVPKQRWGIARVDLPAGWKLHFKAGWGKRLGGIDHQIALLQKRKRRIGIAILTEGNPTRIAGKATVKGVAKRLLRGLPR